MPDLAYLRRKLQAAQWAYVILSNAEGVTKENLDSRAVEVAYWQDLVNRAEGKPGTNVCDAVSSKESK